MSADAGTRPALELQGVRRRFGATPALDGIDLTLGPREILVVLGPTGAGKTTLLRAIAGLEPLDGGRILLDGRDATRLPPAARDVSLVFQNFSLYPGRTVRANLEFPLLAPGRQLGAGEIAERVEWAARLLRIEPLLSRRATQLSGGEMQRVAIGRAIVRRPRLFLMDEPLTNLDAKLREALRVEIPRLVRELGVPLVYVTHDQAEALSMGERIAVLAGGRLLQAGTPEEVYLRPATPEVGRQLGTPPINVVDAVLDGDLWRSAGGEPIAPAPPGSPPRAKLGIRPEHLAPEGGASEAVVELVEETGPTRILVARWADTRVHLSVGMDAPHHPGDAIHPRAAPEHLVVWPAGEPAGRSRPRSGA